MTGERSRRSRGRGRAATAGVLAAAMGVAAGEVGGGIVTGAGSPVVAVGGWVIDNVPAGVKDLAIDSLGTNDKPALVVGTLVVLALIGAGSGLVARRRPGPAGAVVLAVALAGVSATVDQTATSWPAAAAPSLLGATAAVATLVALRRTVVVPPARPVPDEAPHEDDPGPGEVPARRRFLLASAATAVLAGGAAVAGRVLQGRASVAAERAGLVLPRAARRAPAITAAVAPDPAGVAPFVTPNRDFYRIDVNLTVPQVSTGGYRLAVRGMVDRPLEVTWDELLDRDLHEYDITLTCVSNQVGDRLVGNARWLGFPLRDLLDEAGVQPGADQVVGRSGDGYTGGVPLAAAYDRDTIVAVGMNGEPLPLDHGYPVRLVTPGIYGYLGAVKWLTEVEVTTFAAYDSYWVPRGYAEQAPIRTMSRIDTPRSLARVPAGTVALGGVAWAQTRGVERVEVRIDDGAWQEARLSAPLNDDTWRQWTLAWPAAEPGLHTVAVRATDGTGTVQPEDRRDPLPDGATGWHTVRLTVE